MRYLLIFCALSILMACGEKEEEKKTIVPEVEEVLTEVKKGIYKQYYPGKKNVKFEGRQDEAGERHGIWYFYSEKGMKISMTEFKHGKKNGVSLHRYPNGMVHYSGEYEDDLQVGLWKTYDTDGKLVDSTNYDELNKKYK